MKFKEISFSELKGKILKEIKINEYAAWIGKLPKGFSDPDTYLEILIIAKFN